jgi:hypothetical protein
MKEGNTKYCVDTSEFEITLFTGTLAVTSPAEGTKLHQQGTTTLRWQQKGQSAGERINVYVAEVGTFDWLTGTAANLWKFLFDSDHDDSGRDEWISIAKNLQGKTSFDWTIAKNVASKADYKVVVELVDFPAVYATGPQFEIAEAILAVTAPSATNGRMDDIVEGTEVEIKWTHKGIAATDKIKIELKNTQSVFFWLDKTHLTIAESAPNTGSFKWTVPSDGQPPAGENYWFEISWVTDDAINDSTDKFTLVQHPDSIGVNGPPDTGKLLLGQETTVTWKIPDSLKDTNDKVDIYLIEAGLFDGFFSGGWFDGLLGDQKTKVGDGVDAAADTHTYTVPGTIDAADDYRYYIEVVGKSSIDGESVEFSIETTVIVMTSPTGGQSLKEGEQLKMKFEGYGIDGKTKIKLELRDDIWWGFGLLDTTHHTIVEQVFTNWEDYDSTVWVRTEYDWTIPAFDGDFQADDNYYIRASVVGVDDVTDDSETFSINPFAGSIKVVAPATGDKLHTNEQTTITWNVEDVEDKKVNLYLKRDGARVSFLNYLSGKDIDVLTIAEGVENTGTYAWAIPTTENPALVNLKDGPDAYDDYYVVVELADYPSVSANSGMFYLQDAVIELIANGENIDILNEGQEVNEGTMVRLDWSYKGLTGDEEVTLELHKAHVLGFGLVSWFDEKVTSYKATAKDETYQWMVPSDLDDVGKHYFKLIVTENIQDESPTFNIGRQPGTIVVTKPAATEADNGIFSFFGGVGRETFRSNQEIVIDWTATGMPAGAKYSVHLYLEGGLFTDDATTLVAENIKETSYTYTVPSGMAIDDEYFFRVGLMGYPSKYGDSADFELVPATLSFIDAKDGRPLVTGPFSEGQVVEIEWVSDGIPDDAEMTILLLDADWAVWAEDTVVSTLSTTAPNTGKATVQMPKNGLRLGDGTALIPGSGDEYYLKVIWNADTRVEAETIKFMFDKKAGRISVITPAANAELVPLQDYEITWETFPDGSDQIPADAFIDIHLYESRNAFLSLFAADEQWVNIGRTANTGSFMWTVPELPPSDDYYITMTWSEYESVKGDSGEFKVVEAAVYVAPYAEDNSVYIHNDKLTIDWSTTGLKDDEKVDIKLLQYNEPGSFWDIVTLGNMFPTGQAKIADGVSLAAGTYTYTIPKNLPASQHYVVSISVQGKDGIVGTSADYADQAPTNSDWVRIQNHKGAVVVTYPTEESGTQTFGSESHVSWNTTSDIPTDAVMTIELYEETWFGLSEKKYKTITAAAPNTGKFTYTVPTDLDEGNDYYVSVTWNDHPTVTHESEKFGIYGEYIRLDQDTLKGTIQEGEPHTIKWSSKGIPKGSTVSIELFNDVFLWFDSSVKMIAEKLEVEGDIAHEFEWTVPTNLQSGDDYYLKIMWDENNNVFDESGSFRLQGHPGSITVTEPSSDTYVVPVVGIEIDNEKEFVLGSEMNIKWESKDVPTDAMVSITAYLDNFLFADEKIVVTEKTANTGSHTWTIPGGIRKDNGYFIVVQYVEFPSVLGESAEFTTVKGLIDVTTPSSSSTAVGDFLAEGQTYTLLWEADGPGPEEEMTIRLHDDGWFFDDEHAVITTKAKNTGRFEWTLPNDLPVPDTNFYITVEWNADSDVKGESVNFEIRAHPGTITVDKLDKELYVPTQTVPLSWQLEGVTTGTVSLELWHNDVFGGAGILGIFGDGYNKVLDIKTDVPVGTTSFDWTVPFKLNENYVVRVFWNEFPSVVGSSTEFVVGTSSLITDVKQQRSNPFTSDDNPSIYGEDLIITWDASKLSAGTILSIELYDSDAPLGISFGTTWFDEHHADIAKRVRNSGTYTWSIPASGLEVDDTDDFFIVVSVVEDDSISGKSAEFKIEPPVLEEVKVSPEKISAVTDLDVEWNADGFASDANVVVELWDDQGFFSREEKVLVMGTARASDKTLTWIPATTAGLLPSEGYFVKVHWESNANVVAQSDPFEIFHNGPVIRVLQPSEATDVLPGTPTDIEWISHDLPSSHKLALELWDHLDVGRDNKDQFIAEISGEDGEPNTGKFEWTPSQSDIDLAHADSTYFIRIRWEGRFEDLPQDGASDEAVSDSRRFSFIPFSRPGQPALNEEDDTPITHDSINIKWAPALSVGGGTRVLGYEVEVLPLKISAADEPWKNTTCSMAAPCTETSTIIDGLDAGIGYQFRARTIAVTGDVKSYSAWSTASDQYITALLTTTTPSTVVTEAIVVTPLTTVTTITPAVQKPTGVRTIPNLLTTVSTLSSDPAEDTTTGAGGTDPDDSTAVATTAGPSVDDLEEDLVDAEKLKTSLCGSCVDECSVVCNKAIADVAELETKIVAAKSAAVEKADKATAKKSNGGAIAGAVIGILLLVALILALFVYKKREGIPTTKALGNYDQAHENPMYSQTSPIPQEDEASNLARTGSVQRGGFVIPMEDGGATNPEIRGTMQNGTYGAPSDGSAETYGVLPDLANDALYDSAAGAPVNPELYNPAVYDSASNQPAHLQSEA